MHFESISITLFRSIALEHLLYPEPVIGFLRRSSPLTPGVATTQRRTTSRGSFSRVCDYFLYSETPASRRTHWIDLLCS